MERLKTGVPGLDKLLNGGIPQGQQTLISGTCGAGKTILCVQYAHEGLKKYNENGVYLSFEESPDSIRSNVADFGWDFRPFEKKGQFAFIKYDPYHSEDIFDILESAIRDTNAQRVVVDSISAIGLHIRDKSELRRTIFNLSNSLRKLGCTAMLVSEIVPYTQSLSRYGVEEFVADTVIVLYYERRYSQFSRAIQIWKMRGSPHSEKLHPYRITEKGVVVYPEEEAFIKE